MDGVRLSKTENGVTTDFYYAGGMLVGQKTGNNALVFKFDHAGDYYGFTYGNNNYWYIKNLQNDVVAIANDAGNIIVRYYYDAWGRLLSTKDANGNEITNQTHIAHINPIRYRSYYYDTGTGFYFLQSRYYDPEVGRFLSADKLLDERSFDGYNLFVYCGNNPVNASDPSGTIAVTTCILIGSAVAGLAVSAYTGYKLYNAGADWDDIFLYSLCAGLSIFDLALTGGMAAYDYYCQLSYIYGYTPITDITLTKKSSIPQEAYDTYDYVKNHNGSPKPGYKGGRDYLNDGRDGSEVLPRQYAPFKEYDIYPKISGVSRGAERIVISQTSSAAWYTSNHYISFISMER